MFAIRALSNPIPGGGMGGYQITSIHASVPSGNGISSKASDIVL